ncbi:MAG: TRAP transporter large permease [Alphaproteobacteria bacterium]|nr:TRAP transporter large permease [Alphaproteobacteria bacterium]
MTALGVAFALLLAIGVPIAFAIGLASVIGILALDMRMVAVPTRMFTGIDSFVLLAAPFYILAGEIMSRSGITERLVRFSMMVTRNVPGGTAYSVVVAAIMFSGISGTAVGDAAALGQIYIKEMPKEGYSPAYAASVVVASSMMGPIIPPSVIMIVYSLIARVSVIDLFVAGVVPGLMLGLAIALVIFIQGRGGKLPVPQFKVEKGTGLRLLIEGLLILTLPVVIIRGATVDWFTTTEAGGIACVYAGLLGTFVFRQLTLREVWTALVVTAQVTASIYLVLAASEVMSYVFARGGIGDYVQGFGALFAGNKILFLLAVAVLLTVIGTFLEPGPAVILFVPMLLPAATVLGVDPLQFAMVCILTLTLGLITPPVGVCMFVVCKIARINIWQLFAVTWPFLVAETIVVVLLCLVPEFSSWLPRFMKS